MIEKPCTIILFSFLILIIISIIVIVAGYFNLNDNESRDFLIWDDPMVVAWDKLSVGEEYVTAKSGSGSVQPLRMTQDKSLNPVIFYSSENGGSLLDKSNLLKVKEIEDYVKGLDYW